MTTSTKKLYAMAARLGLLERDSKEDAFHQLVYGLTGKEHVSGLSEAERRKVYGELEKRIQLQESVDGMATPAQKNYIWKLIFRLSELDPSESPVCRRLAGAIHATLGITASETEPFRWVSRKDASKLIEMLKRYVKSAERKAENK